MNHISVENFRNPSPFASSEQKESKLTLLLIVNNTKS
jgi:hypothetical protein